MPDQHFDSRLIPLLFGGLIAIAFSVFNVVAISTTAATPPVVQPLIQVWNGGTSYQSGQPINANSGYTVIGTDENGESIILPGQSATLPSAYYYSPTVPAVDDAQAEPLEAPPVSKTNGGNL